MLIRFWCISLKKFHCGLIFSISLTRRYKTKSRPAVLSTDYFKPIILKLKAFIHTSNSNIIHNIYMCGRHTLLCRGEVSSLSPVENFFNIVIFRKNSSKYAELVVEPFVCDNLNQIYRFSLFLTKTFWMSFRNVIENRQEGTKLISFVHLWLYFAGIIIVCSFLKVSSCDLYMIHASEKVEDETVILI